MELDRYLYLVGRFPLRAWDHRVAIAIAADFWVGGRALAQAPVSPTALERRGVLSCRRRASGAVHRLVVHGILALVAPQRGRRSSLYAIRDPAAWRWPARRPFADAAAEYDAMRSGEVTWGTSRRARAADLVAETIAPRGATPHPGDPWFAGWVDRVDALLEHYGREAVAAAAAEAAADRAVVVPYTPDGFLEAFPALVMRARRRRPCIK